MGLLSFSSQGCLPHWEPREVSHGWPTSLNSHQVSQLVVAAKLTIRPAVVWSSDHPTPRFDASAACHASLCFEVDRWNLQWLFTLAITPLDRPSPTIIRQMVSHGATPCREVQNPVFSSDSIRRQPRTKHTVQCHLSPSLLSELIGGAMCEQCDCTFRCHSSLAFDALASVDAHLPG